MKMNQVVTGDCVQALRKCRRESFDLIFADPPFNIGFGYDEYSDKLTHDQYLGWTAAWIRECVRVIAPRGSMFVSIGDEFASDMKIELEKHLFFRNWIIWRYSFGQNCRNKFNRCHAHIFYFVHCDLHFTFNADAVLVPSDRQTKYNDKRAKDGGKVPDDVWDFPRLCGTFKERRGRGHPCQMPESVLERIVRVASDPGDRVLDPFSGSGTTCAVAKRLGRRYLGIELSANYAAASRRRLANVEVGLTPELG